MTADMLLVKLDGVKRTGQDRWLARCPAHGDKRASLSIREAESGAVLVHCFAGCSVSEIVGTVGLELSDLFPPRHDDAARGGKPERRPFPAADILRAVSFETMIVSLAAAQLAKGKPLTAEDNERLKIAAARLQAAAENFQ